MNEFAKISKQINSNERGCISPDMHTAFHVKHDRKVSGRLSLSDRGPAPAFKRFLERRNLEAAGRYLLQFIRMHATPVERRGS